MCSKLDSDATYCSEVETLIKVTAIAPKHSSENVPLRRSQRLSQKLQKTIMFSSCKVAIMKSEEVTDIKNKKDSGKSLFTKDGKSTQDIFSTQDLKDEQEMFGFEEIRQHNISLKKIFSCPSKDAEGDILASGIPLDLSKKSKVSKGETPQEKIQVADEIVELKSCNVQNVIDVANNHNKENTPKVTKQEIVLKVKRGLPRKSSYLKKKDLNAKASNSQYLKKGPIKNFNILKDVNCSAKTSSDITNFNKTALKEKVKISKNFPLISGRGMKQFNHNFDNSIDDKKRTLLQRNIPKRSRKPKNKQQIKKPPNQNTSNSIKSLGYPENIFFANNISCNSKHITENLELDCGKRLKLSDDATTNRRNDKSADTKITIRNKSYKNIKIVTNELNIPEAESKTKIKKTRSQKKARLSGENSHLVELEHVKSEPFVASLDINPNYTGKSIQIEKLNKNSSLIGQLTLTENISATNTNNFKNNSSQAKNEAYTPNSAASCTKSSDELKPSRILRSAIKKRKPSSVQTNISELQNETKKIKTEKLSQKSIKEINPINVSASCICSSENTKQLFDQHVYEHTVNNLTNLKFDTECYTKLSNQKTIICNKLEADLKYKSDKFIQLKKELECKTSSMNKNYIKSFDRNHFLDKIETAKSYINNFSSDNTNFNKLNSFEIPPTPAASSQDLLKKSILSDVYPSHFKHQLPPEAVLARPAFAMTPDNTISSELLESSSSSPSLPESLCELFQNKDIKDILNVERTSYRLYNYHIQGLALILNLRLEYLRKVLDKIINISPNVLRNIDKAVSLPFVPDHDIFATSPDELRASSDMVPNSESSQQRIMSTERTKCQ